jgi:hypothetical protein
MPDMDFRSLLISLLVALSLMVTPLYAADAMPPPPQDAQAKKPTEDKNKAEQKAVFKEAEALKKEIVELNQELYRFEEELLYPANSQFSIYLSLDSKTGFLLDSVELEVDEKMVTSHLYSETEIIALKRGGVQRLYIGSLADGAHKISVQINGLGANNRYFRNKQRANITKENSAKHIELVVSESGPSREPTTKIKQW